MACSAPADINEWTACNVDAVVQPVVDAAYGVAGVVVTLAILFAGIVIVRKLIRHVGAS